MNLTGIGLGLFTVAVIGLGFLWVIKLEYYIGAHVAKLVGVFGLAVILVSLFIPGFIGSALVGIAGGTIVWGATELPDQERRVAAGMFKKNPKKRPKRGERS
jgi:hypothetical protein